jgi:6-phosphogluconolactonase
MLTKNDRHVALPGVAGGRRAMAWWWMIDREKIRVFENGEKIADALMVRWREISRRAIADKGYFAAAVSGGNTPIVFYRKLVEAGTGMAWEQTHVFLVDERCVPFTSPESNYGRIRGILLNGIALPPVNLHPIPVMKRGPRRSAESYERELIRFFRLRRSEVPRFDLVLLGIGEDGHTASLFPDTSSPGRDDHLAKPVLLDRPGHDRVTLTLRLINHAAHIIFFVTGREKAPILRRVIEEQDPSLPASRVSPSHGDLMFMIDRAAAMQLHLAEENITDD